MVAPKNNQYWKLRSKHGRNRIFPTPESLWDAAVSYFKWSDSHPMYRVETFQRGGELIRVEVPCVRPYTLAALCLHLRVSKSFWREFRSVNKKNEDFSTVIERVELIIETQQVEGVAVGAFKGNIISFFLGAMDKKANSVKIGYDVNKITGMQIEQLPSEQADTCDACMP